MNIDFLKNRATVRSYSSTPIDENLLTELFEVACQTSTTGNMQLYSIVVTKEKSMKLKLAPLHFNQPMVAQAPVVLTFCADYNRFTKWCELNNADSGCDNFQAFMTAAIDALLVAQTFCVAAEAKGLGICYLGTTTYNAKQIAEALELPKYVVPITTITLGYPANAAEQSDRLPLSAVVHRERYTDYSSENIRSFYSVKENLESSRRFVAENGKENLAQVYTEVRYPRANFEHFSAKLAEVIREQGFEIQATNRPSE